MNNLEAIDLTQHSPLVPAPVDLVQEVQQLRQHVATFQFMLDMIAHELSTPLTLLSGYMHLLQAHSNLRPDSEASEYLQIMAGTIERLMWLVNDLVDLAQAEAGRIQLNTRRVDGLALLRKIALEFRPILASKGQSMTVEATGEPPPALADPVRLAQIINNLFSNAGKYSSPGSKISVQIALTTGQDCVQISIRDTGSGIAATDLSQIFQRYYRTSAAEQSDVRGAGLGLYIARLLVEAHGGMIWCESTPGLGSTFHFTLPIYHEFTDDDLTPKPN